MRLSSIQNLKALLCLSILSFSGPLFAEDGRLPSFNPLKLEVSESISSVGSDSMKNLMESLVKDYNKVQPSLTVNLVNRGSSLAPAALLDGSAKLGQMAREMKESEVKYFKNKYGFEPTRLKTALAASLVYTSSKNPLKSISLEELDAIYSSKRLRGALSSIKSWGDFLALERSSIKGAKIKAYVPAEGSATRSYFKQKALLQDTFNGNVLSYASLDDALQKIKNDESAILIGAYRETLPEGVKAISVESKQNSANKKAYSPSLANIYSLDYPLARFLNIYTLIDPKAGMRASLGKEKADTSSILRKKKSLVLERSTKDFLHFVLSREGQRVVKEQGLIPISSAILSEQRALISN